MIVGMLALAGYGAGGGQGAEATGYQVKVYVKDQQVANQVLFARAQALATSMFAGIGVRLRWEVGGPRRARGCQSPPAPGIVIRLASETPAGFHPGAMAYSRPYAPQSEVRVIIFYDRVLGSVLGTGNEGVTFLGHVLAHEIGHVLQGVARHSEAGIMKAQWVPEDRAQMRMGPLPFTAYDAELIHRGMAKEGVVEMAPGRRQQARSAAGGAIIP
jgi:hypothetical protein